MKINRLFLQSGFQNHIGYHFVRMIDRAREALHGSVGATLRTDDPADVARERSNCAKRDRMRLTIRTATLR